MKHYKAIMLISSRITELNLEVKKLEQITENESQYSGYVFVKDDIKNMIIEIEQLTVTLKKLSK